MQNEKKYDWFRIDGASEEIKFGSNGLVKIIVEDKEICLVKTTNGIRACSNKCPHAGGKMAEGKIDSHQNIVCCVHNYHFNLEHGRDTLGEGYFLKIYPIRENEEGIFIGM
ncbi:MAG: Rieske 2Fe-2S domain-containing protein [Ginsengibacter sp.]